MGWEQSQSLEPLAGGQLCVPCLPLEHVGSFRGPRRWHWKVGTLLSGVSDSLWKLLHGKTKPHSERPTGVRWQTVEEGTP